MCTLTVIPREDGYLLGMNRDERLTRGGARPPEVVPLSGITRTRLINGFEAFRSGPQGLKPTSLLGLSGTAEAVPFPKSIYETSSSVYPRDGEGGTWIAANDHGIALALLNWNDVAQPGGDKIRSRGEIIPALMAHASRPELGLALEQLDLRGIWPCRLVGVFPEQRVISEWRWNSEKLEIQTHEWKPKHWFSSSLSDAQATVERGAVCRAAWKEPDSGSLVWLRRLHASHGNGPGPFSLCVHRENVGTLSYTEINCEPKSVECVYFGGAPCTCRTVGESLRIGRLVRLAGVVRL